MINKSRNIKRIVSISAAAVCMMSALNFAPLNDRQVVDAADVMTAFEITENMKIGWNYGNSLDATGGSGLDTETSWGNPKCKKETIKAVKDKGFNTVRLPTTWYKHMNADGIIDPEWFARVREIIDWCYEEDMYVILNIHHEEWINRADFDTAYDEMSVKLKSVWKQIAEEFKDYDQHLIFEGMNEPRAAGTDYEWWLAPSAPKEKLFEVVNKLNQDFVDTVRSVESPYKDTRLLSCPPYCASGSDINMMAGLDIPDDPYVAASVHAYSPYSFCMDKAGDHSTFSETYATELEGILKNIRKQFIDNNIPVILGEFSASNYNNTEARCEWAKTYISLAKSYGFPCVLWDNDARGNSDQSEAHDYLDRETNTWYEDSGQVVDAMMAVLADDSIVWGGKDFTTQKQYTHKDLSSGTEITDVAGSYDSSIEGKEGSPAKVIKFSEFKDKDIAVKYTGGDPELAFMDAEWGGWTTVKPYYIDEKNGIAYFSSDDIKTAWEGNNGDVSKLNSFIIRANGQTTVEKSAVVDKGELVDKPDNPITSTATTTSGSGNITTTTTTATTTVPDDFKFEVVKLPVTLTGEKTIKFTIEGTPTASVGGGICYDDGEWASIEWSGNIGSDRKLEMEVDISKIPSSVKDAEIQIWWSNVWDNATETGIDKPAKVSVSGETDIVYGDANEDNIVNIADAVLIMQSLSNGDQYKISEKAQVAADVFGNGDGITNKDALVIQLVEAKVITAADLPLGDVMPEF